MDLSAIMQQFTIVPVIVLPLALVLVGSVVWLKVVERFFPSPEPETEAVLIEAEIEEPIVYIATPVSAEEAGTQTASEGEEATVLPPVSSPGYDRTGAYR
jgi:hypothetical protein